MNSKWSLFLAALTAICSVGCQPAKGKIPLSIIIQPEIETDERALLTIYSEAKFDADSTLGAIEGLEFYSFSDHIWSERSTEFGEKEIFCYYAEVTPAHRGTIEIPSISVLIDATQYQTALFAITAKDSIALQPNSIKAEWGCDKSSYTLKDTIKLTLYQYSKFEDTDTAPLHDGTSRLDEEVGVSGFNAFLDSNFAEWQGYKVPTPLPTMEELDGELYIKTEIFFFELCPAKKGEFVIEPSTLQYIVYKNPAARIGELAPNEDGTYSYAKDNSHKMNVTSNSLKIVVK